MRVLEMYKSLEGEGSIRQGKPTIFIRLAGCSIHCRTCDTKYSWDFNSGINRDYRSILKSIVSTLSKESDIDKTWISITGGNPLEHKGLENLMFYLKQYKLKINLEHPGIFTSLGDEEKAAIELSDILSFDIKTPSTGISSEVLENSILTIKDYTESILNPPRGKQVQIKMVIDNLEDLQYAHDVIDKAKFNIEVPIILQPSAPECTYNRYVIADPNFKRVVKEIYLALGKGEFPENVRLGVQIHKVFDFR